MKIAIKIGTSCVIDNRGKVEYSIIKKIAKQIAILQKKGYQIVIIASGSIGCGRIYLKPRFQFFKKEYITPSKNILAACGQAVLNTIYNKALSRYNLIMGQLLITKEQTQDQIYMEHICNVIQNTWNYRNIIPIINENDAIVPDGFLFHDNDELTSLLAIKLKVHKVIMLTSINGVYKNSNLIEENFISNINVNHPSSIEFFEKTSVGRGGMSHKIDMCSNIAKNGIVCHIYNARKGMAILDVLKNPNKYGTTIHSTLEK